MTPLTPSTQPAPVTGTANVVARGSVLAVKRSAISGPTPRIKCSINQDESFKSWANLLIDIGCTINAVPSALAESMDLQVEEVDPENSEIRDVLI